MLIETAAAQGASRGSRARKVLAGEGMVQPTQPLRPKDPDLGYVLLLPGRDRLSPDHPLVAAHPECFEPCIRNDPYAAKPLRAHLERQARLVRAAIRSRGGTSQARPRPSGAPRLARPPLRPPGRSWPLR